MTKALIVVLVGCLFVVRPSPAFAWGKDGHRIVCAIAWDEMKPRALQRVKRILDVETKEQFAELCNYADEYRTWHGETTGWHFVDVPPGATSVDTVRDCSSPDSCVVVQIEKESARLQRNDESPEKQAMTLKFLMHFVGDAHQPLHASYARDKGGTEIKGKFLGKETHLHRVWDSGILGADGRPWEEIAADLERRVTPAERKEWTASRPLDWANESLAIALSPATGYATHGDDFTLGEDYARANLPIVIHRLQQAGVRLGDLLSHVLG